MRFTSWGIVAVAVAALSACGARSRLGESSDGGGDGAAFGDGPSGGSSGGRSVDGAASSSSGGSSGGSSGSGGCPPVLGRPSGDYLCLQPPTEGNCNFDGTPEPGKCFVDSACADAGAYGRCIRDGHGPASCVCTFDTCTGDSTCPAGFTCACHGAQYMDGRGNTCVPSNCRTDSDCGPGGSCSPTLLGGCGGIGGYYCHTPSDGCTTDCDCTMIDASQYCAYDPVAGHWGCRPAPACM